MDEAKPGPEMSVVVPVRRANETAVHTLGELLDRKWLEVIAVVSSADPGAPLLRDLAEYCRELVLVEVSGDCSVPQLRAHGIRRARGRLVAITEADCSFSDSWPAALAPPLARPEIGAAGGVVVNGRRESLLDWAVYFSRYAASMPPLPRGPAGALPGNNACYRRELLDSLSYLYQDGFWEHEFHQRLLESNMRLWVEPDALVSHNKRYHFAEYCALRFRHARCYGGKVRNGSGVWSSLIGVIRSPVIPLLLLARSAGAVFSKRSHLREYLLSAPVLLVFYLAWSAGELSGYVLGAGEACSQTD